MSGNLDPTYSVIADTQGDTVAVNTDGSISNAYTDGVKNTYSQTSTLISLPASATDIFTISGSATKIIRLLKVEITGIQTTAGSVPIILVRRGTPNTGGTIAFTLHGFPHDTNNPLATATVNIYSANPASLGVALSFIRNSYIYLPAAASTSAPTALSWNLTDVPGQAVVLRGVNELLAINMNAATVTGGQIIAMFEWTEE